MFPTGEGLVHITNRKGASPHPQPERGRSISPTGNEPVHIQLERGRSISLTGKGRVHIPNREVANPNPNS